MSFNEPSPMSINTPVDIETSNLSSCSLSALLIGALSQVATTIELTNRVYDRYMGFQTRPTLDRALPSGTKPAFP
jgi:hypothetical protein